MNVKKIFTTAMNPRLAITVLVLILVLVMTDSQVVEVHAAVRIPYLFDLFPHQIYWLSILFTDINECIANTHNCHVDATCVNSEGSFNCTCNEGFSGSGQSCSGTCLNMCYVHTYLKCFRSLNFYFLDNYLKQDAEIRAFGPVQTTYIENPGYILCCSSKEDMMGHSSS